MGAFFTNVQLKTSELDKSNLPDAIIHHIIQLNNKAGFAIVNNENDADKSVIILHSNDLAWVSIYDEETEDQSSRKLNKLASELSKQFNTTALSIIVNDSDWIYVGINVNGKLKDSIKNFSKKIDINKNEPTFWSGIFADKYSFDDLKSAWQTKTFIVEDFLTQLAGFINLDASKLLTGYEYLNEEIPNEGIKLNFTQKAKENEPELGLTKFCMLVGAGLVDVNEGITQNTEWIITNQGTFSYGLDIIIAGDCIEQGLLIPEIVKASYLKPQSGKQNEFTVSFVETVATTGEKISFARIEDIYIPKGFLPTYPMTPKESKRYLKISYDPAIKFNISFFGGKEGTGDFTIFFCPLVNRQAGSCSANLMKGRQEDWMKKHEI